MMEETTIDVKRKMTPSIPANYVTILQLRERWIKEKEQKQQRKEQEEKDEERRRNQHADEEEHIIIIEEDPKKPQEEDLDQKHWGGNSEKDESTTEKEETAAIEGERGDDEGLPEKKRGRRKRYDRRKKKRTNQEVEECGGSIKPPEYTVKENNTKEKDQIRVYKKKEVGNKSVEKAVETQFEHLSIKRVQQVNKHLKAQTRSSLNRNPIETASMVWVKKKGQNDERAVDGNGSGVKPLHA